ncbi:MAG: [FeFe] hydrogenase H-cluster maturation GTPase HydF, partial [Clostridia bacterium]|nr:[FeFe] hydrogenase H-cluster maturation GTPase HydF [Clostridia bacterium]
MGLNDTPSANRVHIGFFGRRNAGKSSVVNAVTGQELAVVSDVRGTTTDPVYKSMELLPLGPVMIIDTPGFDDEGKLGEMRIRKTKQVLNKTDIAVLIVDGTVGLTDCDNELIELFKEKDINYLVVYNKSDLQNFKSDENAVEVSAETGEGIYQLKERIAALNVKDAEEKHIVADLIEPGDYVMLITPIDSAAPKGRLILPQQQTVRDIIDAGAYAVVTRETEFAQALSKLGTKPKIVITDSQVFERASKETPDDILLTSFSILMARYKGFLEIAVNGAAAIDNLKDGDSILISEGCTHHRQ